MRNYLSLFIFIIVFSDLRAQQPVIHLWPGQVPGQTAEKNPAVFRDSLQHVIRITDITDPLLTAYLPAKAANNHVGIIISPGGGNKYLAIDLEGYEIAEWLSRYGYTAFVLNYRVPNQPEGSLQDLQRALRLIRSHAKTYGLDTGKIGVMGFSAGGNLSARGMTNFDKRTYAQVDAADKTNCRPDFALLIYPGSLSTGADHHLIPEIPVSAQTPKTFIFVAADDQYGPPFSLAYALKDNKIPYELHVSPKGGHGYGLRKGNPAAETWPALALKWLEQFRQ